MKKPNPKQRAIDVKRSVQERRSKRLKGNTGVDGNVGFSGQTINTWIDRGIKNGLLAGVNRNYVTITLPEVMNFSQAYVATVLHLQAIRKLTTNKNPGHRTYKLRSVKFNQLKSLSTAAALVLTAELSRWDDNSRKKLKPETKEWNSAIYNKLDELGFFDLFSRKPSLYNKSPQPIAKGNIVRYIKGCCGDADKARLFKERVLEVIGHEVTKWTFLHCGLTEAITNVGHHAYPDGFGYTAIDKAWYLTGSYNDATRELEIAFYDQGIGIPKSLPASAIYEKLLVMLSSMPVLERKKDETLLRAAVELNRTSTYELDRGKGLQDLLEFIRQRKSGNLTIFSQKGKFKLSIVNGVEKITTNGLACSIQGTLIIWKAVL